MLSARLGDVLAELYLLSAVLKRWQHEGRHDADLPLVQCCLEQGFVTIERRLDEVLLNFPSRALSFFLRALVLPFFWRAKPPSDKVLAKCEQILLEPSGKRDRLGGEGGGGHDSPSIEQLEQAFELAVQAQLLRDRLRHGE